MESKRVNPPPEASSRHTEAGESFNRALFSAVDAIEDRSIPYAVIGGIAASGLGRPRWTHDIDIFVRPEDALATLEALSAQGFDTERTDERWLFKGFKENMLVDIIFKSHGDIYFDQEMQERASMVNYHGHKIRVVSPEDLIIIKCAVHNESGPHHWHDALAILSHASLDWNYLIKRARRAPRRLLALLVYAQSNDIWIPNQIIFDLFHSIFGDAKARPSLNEANGPRLMKRETSFDENRPPPVKRSETSAQPSGRSVPDTYLIGKVKEAITTDPRTAAPDIRVAIGGNCILVKGQAQSEEQRHAIEEVILTTAPGYTVDNQVRIRELRAPEGVEEVV